MYMRNGMLVSLLLSVIFFKTNQSSWKLSHDGKNAYKAAMAKFMQDNKNRQQAALVEFGHRKIVEKK